MNKSVQELQEWFGKQSVTDKEEVLKFVYGATLEKRGMYVGPVPGMLLITEGLHVGTAPSVSASSNCPTCGKPR
jgi:hypothetical protein